MLSRQPSMAQLTVSPSASGRGVVGSLVRATRMNPASAADGGASATRGHEEVTLS